MICAASQLMASGHFSAVVDCYVVHSQRLSMAIVKNALISMLSPSVFDSSATHYK